MKKAFILLLSVVCLSACEKSNEDKAKEAVDKYLKENLKDPSSYEFMSIGTIDSTYSRVADEPQYKDGIAKAEDNLAKARLLVYDNTPEAEMQSKALLDESKSIMKKVEEFTISYKPSFNGYKVNHKYRAKNSYGALNISEQTFYLNKDLTEVVNVVKVD